MNNARKMSRKKIQSTIIYIIIGIGSLFLIGHRFFPLFPRMMAQASSCIAYPALVVHCHVIDPIKVWFYQRKTMQKLRQKLEKIYKERDTLLAENIALRAAADYSKDITELITFKAQYEIAHARIAQVLVRHLSDQAHFFLIDVGRVHGIQVDMVATYKNCLIGKVIEVYPWYSKVELITDARSKIAGYCAATNVQGIYEGINNEHQTTLAYVSHLDQVKKGDMIMSSGEGLIFPRGFALGRVTAIAANGLYHTITAQPLVDLRHIKYCAIIARGTDKIADNNKK